MTFVFYDTETTGTNTAFDQILQFGAICTDDDFGELERFEIRSRILPHIVPSPGAMRVTGVTAEQLEDPVLPSHYQMVCRIREKLLSWSPAIFIGHNTLGFDEHLLRQALYKTLFPPYLTNSNGNGRTDSLRLLQALVQVRPNAIVVPEGDTGRPSFKLDRLAPANGFIHENAHDAMADVEATIHMCRLLAEREPDLWERSINLARKAAVLDFAGTHNLFGLTEFYYGRPYSRFVVPIGVNPRNSSELLVFDLTNDPQDLLSLNERDLEAALTRRPKPVRSIRANTAPVLWPVSQAPATLRDGAAPIADLETTATAFRKNSEASERLVGAYMATREEFEPSEHLEEQIYQGFASPADMADMDRFHTLDWPARLAVARNLGDKRFKSLGQRLVYSEAPQVLSDDMRFKYDEAVARRLMENPEIVPWLTLPKAIEECADLLTTATGADAELLKGHLVRLQTQADWATDLLS